MYSMYNRIYNIFYMGMTAICTVAGIGALMAYFYSMDAKVTFDVAKIDWFVRSSQRGFEEAQLYFNINANLSELIHVNTRLFYSYILAEWGTSDTDKHSSILWDRLIKREDPAFIKESVPASYTIRQVGPLLRGQQINLSFRIQLIPFVGFFRTQTLYNTTLTLPKEYIPKKK